MPVHKRCPHLVSPQKEGEFTLHGRAILEMDQYIRETYPDAVKVCNICRSLLIQVLGAGWGALCRAHSGPRPLTTGISSEASDDKCTKACFSLVLLLCPRLFLFLPPALLCAFAQDPHCSLRATTRAQEVPSQFLS